MVCVNPEDSGFVTLFRVYAKGTDAKTQFAAELNDKAQRAIAVAALQPAEVRKLTDQEKAQAASDLAPALKAAAEDKPAFDQRLTALGKELGANVKLADLKGGDRLLQKHVVDNEYKVAKMRDLVRGSLVVRSPEEARAALERVKQEFDVARVKDRFPGGNEGPTSAGYSDILTNVRLPGGIDGEIQIHIPEMLAVKDLGHKLYDVTRQMGDNDDRKPGMEQMQSEIYGAALRANQQSNLLRPVRSQSSNSARERREPSVPAFKALGYGYPAPSAWNATCSPVGKRTTGTESTSKYVDSTGVSLKFIQLRPPKESIADLRKFNPSHDERGRFATADSPGMKLRSLYSRMVEPGGGFTYNPRSGTEPTTGLAVSIHPERSAVFDPKTVRTADLFHYVANNADLLAQDGSHLGAWNDPDSGKLFLDVTHVLPESSPDAARQLCLDHDQIAYFRLSDFTTITVNRDAKSGGVVKHEQARTVADARQGHAGRTSPSGGAAMGKADGQENDPSRTRRGSPDSRRQVQLVGLIKEFSAPTSATSGIQPYGSGQPPKRKARRRPRQKINGRTVTRQTFA